MSEADSLWLPLKLFPVLSFALEIPFRLKTSTPICNTPIIDFPLPDGPSVLVIVPPICQDVFVSNGPLLPEYSDLSTNLKVNRLPSAGELELESKSCFSSNKWNLPFQQVNKQFNQQLIHRIRSSYRKIQMNALGSDRLIINSYELESLLVRACFMWVARKWCYNQCVLSRNISREKAWNESFLETHFSRNSRETLESLETKLNFSRLLEKVSRNESRFSRKKFFWNFSRFFRKEITIQNSLENIFLNGSRSHFKRARIIFDEYFLRRGTMETLSPKRQ